MKRYIAFLIVFVFSGASLIAGIVPEKRAEKLALNYYNYQRSKQINTRAIQQFDNVRLYGEIPEYYVFYNNSEGFVMVSAEDQAWPVLGYSLKDKYEPDNMAAGMHEWMNMYSEQIKQLRDRKIKSERNQRAWNKWLAGEFDVRNKRSVSALLETRWDQDWPYNMYCPVHSGGPGGHCYAGCVATAMGQVMKYYDYPEHGRYSHSIFYGDYISVDFGEATYSWDSMTNSANTLSRTHIAELLYHCGVSVDMNYSPDGSGSSIYASFFAMKHYFRYKPGMEMVEKYMYEDAEWKHLLAEDLDKGHPILYRGTGSSGGGHAFVCDGYQDTSYFHFNWGWSGYGNGYYFLDQLGPNESFHWDQGAVINIMPYWGEYCSSMVYDQENWSFDDGSGPNYYWNDTDCDWLIQPTDAENIKLQFTDFKTYEGDILYIYDGSNSDAPLIGAFSGNSLPVQEIISSGPVLYLQFVTDGEGQTDGWAVEYESLGTGISDDLQQDIKIYPNPASEFLMLDLPEHISVTAKIFDSYGKCLKNVNVLSGKQRISIADLSCGLYIVKLESQLGAEVKKLVIE